MIDSSILLIAIIGAISVALLFLLFLKQQRKYPYFSREKLLTEAELKFYRVLRQTIPSSQTIACKVRLADIINCSNSNWQKGHGAKISSKHIDFVLIESETSEILLCIELDDSSHKLPNRQKRDIFVNKSLAAADVPILRIKVARGYDMTSLQKEIKIALN